MTTEIKNSVIIFDCIIQSTFFVLQAFLYSYILIINIKAGRTGFYPVSSHIIARVIWAVFFSYKLPLNPYKSLIILSFSFFQILLSNIHPYINSPFNGSIIIHKQPKMLLVCISKSLSFYLYVIQNKTL